MAGQQHTFLRDLLSGEWLFFAGGDVDLYRYTWSSLVVSREPTGLYGGVDGAVFAAGGAIIGIIGQGVGDLVSGHLSSWQNMRALLGVVL